MSLSLVFCCIVACDGSSKKKADPKQSSNASDPARTATIFIEPHSGGLQLLSDHRQDLHLRVANPYLGRTQLVVDGMLQGTLVRPGPIGQLNLKTLRLHFLGGLTPAKHTLQLMTTGVAGPAFSPEIVLEILPGPSIHPFALLDPIPWLRCENMDTIDGVLSGVVFFGLDHNPSQGRICRGSDATTCIDFHSPDQLPFQNESDRFAFTLLEQEGNTTLRIAWLQGKPAHTVMWQALDWSAAKRDTPASLKGEALVHRHDLPRSEWSEFTSVTWIEGNLLVGFHAPADTESPRPGDQGLLTIPWKRFPDSPKPLPESISIRRMSGDWIDDMDQLGPIFDPANLEFSINPGLVARFAKTRAIHLIPQAFSLMRVESLTPPSGPRTINAIHSLAMVRGALGSQTIAAVDHLGRHQVIASNQPQMSARTISSPQQINPPGIPSAPISGGLVAGHPVFLVPFGARRKSQVIHSNGSVARTSDLAIHCDQMLPLPDSTNQNPDQLAILCLINGEVKHALLDSHG